MSHSPCGCPAKGDNDSRRLYCCLSECKYAVSEDGCSIKATGISRKVTHYWGRHHLEWVYELKEKKPCPYHETG